jgi:hypothetical protein
MGGIGSGRSSGSGRTTVEMCRSIDINRWHKSGVLTAGWSGGWQWTQDGEKMASIGVRGGRDQIVLIYRWKQADTDWQDVVETIRIQWRSCRFGGERPFFECPGVVNGTACRRAVLKLSCAGRYYLCRHCYRLTYGSRNEDQHDRALRRANKIRAKLNGEPGLDAVFPRRPKGMWRVTYERMFDEVIALESLAEERLEKAVARIMDLDRKSHSKTSTSKKGYWR